MRTLGCLGAVMLVCIAMSLWSEMTMAQSSRPATWEPSKAIVEKMLKERPEFRYCESDVLPYTLPDALKTPNGKAIGTAAEWESVRRTELLELFRSNVYGREPKPLDVTFENILRDAKALDGQATHRRVRIHVALPAEMKFAFEVSLFFPNQRRRPAPAFVLINNRSDRVADVTRKERSGFWPVEMIIARGYATAVFQHRDVQPDRADALNQGIIGACPQPEVPSEERWGAISAWAFGCSRVLDYLQTVPEIDSKKVAVIGHSRGGKVALWAAATDERFALAISNDAGRGGASLSRRRIGETVACITKEFSHWFCDRFDTFAEKEDSLPVDQHELIALIAPRAVHVASADEDLWADPRGEFLSLANASSVYALYGQPAITESEMPSLDGILRRGNRAYHIRSGSHDLTEIDWAHYLDTADLIFH